MFVKIQVLEFLPELFEALRVEGYALTEAEAAIFLPCLVEKVGFFSFIVEMFPHFLMCLACNCELSSLEALVLLFFFCHIIIVLKYELKF